MSNDYSSLGYFIAGLGAFAFVMVLVLIAVYIVAAIGIKKVLNYYGHRNPWMAFIPIVSTIALVQCMEADHEGNVFIFGKPIEKKWFQWFPVLQFLVGYVPMVGGIASTVLGVVCLFHLYKDLLTRADNRSTDYTLLAAVSSVIGIVWIVLCYTKFKRIISVENMLEKKEA